jgi:hypothetical protein
LRLKLSKTIDRPPGVVWQFFAIDHVRNHPRWDPHMQLRSLTEGPMRVGTRIQRRQTRTGTRIEGVMEIIEFEPERAMGAVIRDEMPGGTLELRSRLILEPIGSHGTELTAELELPVAAASMDPSMLEASLARMKELIEAETPATRDEQ